ncbi:MAG: cation diffusion facilitator family transporter [Bacteroidales bacterium]
MTREEKIIRASWWAIAGNALLAALKLVTGFVTGSFAVVADGIDSSTDIATSVVVLVAARIMSRPPNVRFAYGYKKADTVASKILSFVIFFAGAQLAWSSVNILLHPTEMAVPDALAIWITLVSIGGKFILAQILYRTGKTVDSQMLTANARNMRNDILISLSVLSGLVFTLWLNAPIIDRIIALVISGFIMYTAFKIFLKSNIDLMDGIDDTQLYCQLFDAVRSVPGAQNPHRVRARKIGHSYMVNLDIEVEASLTVKQAHEISRQVENSIKTNLRNVYDVMVHVEPLGNAEEERYGLRESDVKEDRP